MDLTQDMLEEIVTLGASQLARRISAGELSCECVVETHIRRIEQADAKINALVVRCFDRARREARELDQRLLRGETLGPLAGVPITIKECFFVEGTPATIGVARFEQELSEEDSPLVKRLRAAGAIVLGKTNVPQLMVLHETDNPVYGRTNNPWALDRAPGGSSGGEAAIIAAGGSPLGLGSDLGGSIRVPAHVCGIAGLKPTTGRLTIRGVRTNFHGMEALRGQPGPMARNVEDLDLAMRVLITDSSEDPDELPLPWPDYRKIDIRHLRVGIWTDDGYIPASPGLRRAVTEAADALRCRGATIVSFQPPDVQEAVAIYYGLISADGTKSLDSQLDGSQGDRRVLRLIRLGMLSGRMRTALGWWLENRGQHRLAKLVRTTGSLSAYRYWLRTHERSLYVDKFLQQWREAEVDVMLCPPHALPALKHGTSVDLTTAASYCFVINMLDVPSGVVPITTIGSQEESDREDSRDQVDRTATKVEQESAGLPVGVQVSALHWREDIVLAVMNALQEHFRNQPGYPCWSLPKEWSSDKNSTTSERRAEM